MPPFVHTLRVRYHECDPQSIVFNAQYFAYFDIAMTELWRAAFERSYATMIADFGIDMVVAEATARFLGSARFDDLVDVEAAITRLGTTGNDDADARAAQRVICSSRASCAMSSSTRRPGPRRRSRRRSATR